MQYPVVLTPDDNDTIMVTFPDVPEAITYGHTREEALARAPDALLTIFDALMRARRPIPFPSPVKRKGRSIIVPALESAKIALYREMRAADISKSELARRLHWHPPQVDRLFEIRHGSKLDQLEAAFGALGKRIEVGIRDAASPAAVQHLSIPMRSSRHRSTAKEPPRRRRRRRPLAKR